MSVSPIGSIPGAPSAPPYMSPAAQTSGPNAPSFANGTYPTPPSTLQPWMPGGSYAQKATYGSGSGEDFITKSFIPDMQGALRAMPSGAAQSYARDLATVSQGGDVSTLDMDASLTALGTPASAIPALNRGLDIVRPASGGSRPGTI